MSRRRSTTRPAFMEQVPGQLLMFEVPSPSTCICPRGKTASLCGYDRHCGACDRCPTCARCSGPGCTCTCKEATR